MSLQPVQRLDPGSAVVAKVTVATAELNQFADADF
jgi:hypothetical protein